MESKIELIHSQKGEMTIKLNGDSKVFHNIDLEKGKMYELELNFNSVSISDLIVNGYKIYNFWKNPILWIKEWYKKHLVTVYWNNE